MENNLLINIDKSLFHVLEVEFVGFQVGKQGIQMSQKKVEDIVNWPAVRNWFSSICFSLYVFYLWQFWWILLGYNKARFWPVLAPTHFGHVWIRKDYLGLVLLFFPCSFLPIFLYYYLSYSCIILS